MKALPFLESECDSLENIRRFFKIEYKGVNGDDYAGDYRMTYTASGEPYFFNKRNYLRIDQVESINEVFEDDFEDESFIQWDYWEVEGGYIIPHLFVKVSDRRKGIATKMLTGAIEEMRTEGKANTIKIASCSWYEDHQNPIEEGALVKFYEGFGFVTEWVCDEITYMTMDI